MGDVRAIIPRFWLGESTICRSREVIDPSRLKSTRRIETAMIIRESGDDQAWGIRSTPQ
jgi:hypothetical protein